MTKINITFVLALFLLGCSASGPIYKQAEALSSDNATVYVYRPSRFLDGAGWANILVNDVKEFPLRNKGYGVLILEPGHHTITAKGNMLLTSWRSKPVKLSIKVEAGEEYFVRLLPEADEMNYHAGIISTTGHATLVLLPVEEALSEISETRRVN